MRIAEDYYEGKHPLPFLTKAHSAKMHDEFHRLLKESSTNFMRLVVDVVAERLTVEGIRLSSSSDVQTDKDSWDIWQANHFDTESTVGILDALIKGVSYISVWAAEDDEDYPVMAIEDACETICHYSAGSGYRYRDAALKIWTDEEGDERANVYLPEGIYKFAAKEERQEDYLYLGNIATPPPEQNRWEEIDDSFVANPIGIVPIVPLRNRPRIRTEGESELSDVIKTQNQINGFLFLMALAGYFGAHKQRWASGIPVMVDEKTGKGVEPFETDISKLWVAEGTDAKFGEFSQTDLDGYIKAIEQKVLHIAVTTRTPRHYLIEQGQSPSGDAIKSAESGLIKKTEKKMDPLGEGFEEAILLARMFNGEEGDEVDSEIVWSDAGTETEAETTDAVIKKYQAKLIPREQALEDLGYTQTQIARMMSQSVAEDLLAPPAPPVLNPPAPAVPAPTNGVV